MVLSDLHDAVGAISRLLRKDPRSATDWASIALLVSGLDLKVRKALALAELSEEAKRHQDPEHRRVFSARLAKAMQTAMRKGASSVECEEVILEARKT